MKIDKAIELLAESAWEGTTIFNQAFLDALKLGIEASKAYLKAQDAGWYPLGFKLPGETDE